MQWNVDVMRYINGLPFVPVTFPYNKSDGILVENIQLNYIVEYIQRNQIKKAFISGLSNFDFLLDCPSLEHIAIELNVDFREYSNLIKKGNKYYKKFDVDCFYKLPNLKSVYIIDAEQFDIKKEFKLDLSRLKNLELYGSDYKYAKNISNADELKSLWLNHYKKEDFTELCRLSKLDTIQIIFSKLKSLDGCEKFSGLQCLYLNYNRVLEDINALQGVGKTLKALRIENCSKIQDFSVLGKLPNLELLELTGNNKLNNLDFLKHMKNLKTFTFNMDVMDGDLSLCQNLSYVYSEKDRRHFNLKDKELPKIKYFRGNENIDEWRRFE